MPFHFGAWKIHQKSQLFNCESSLKKGESGERVRVRERDDANEIYSGREERLDLR